jgi:hypothetical protein
LGQGDAIRQPVLDVGEEGNRGHHFYVGQVGDSLILLPGDAPFYLGKIVGFDQTMLAFQGGLGTRRPYQNIISGAPVGLQIILNLDHQRRRDGAEQEQGGGGQDQAGHQKEHTLGAEESFHILCKINAEAQGAEKKLLTLSG